MIRPAGATAEGAAPAAVWETLSEHALFGGVQRFYRHASAQIGLAMRFGLYLPPQALAGAPVPLLVFLAGLTCTEETFAMKAGAQRLAAELGQPLQLRRHAGYDHSYRFIASMVDAHLRHHARQLMA